MPIAQGTQKVVAYRLETVGGTPPGTTGGRQIRRVTADFNLVKDAFESGEIRADRQMADFRHGIRSAEGSISGELSAGTYNDFIGSLLARNFTATALGAAVSITVTTAAGVSQFVRTTGSWITSGFEVGMVIRGTGFTAPADNNKNFLVTAVTALNLSVVALNGVHAVAQPTAASVTFTSPGGRTFVPLTGHTDQSYSIEQWFPDVPASELYTGMKVNSLAVSLPATGLTTVDVGFAGRDLGLRGTTQYYVSPTAQNTNGIFAAVNGAVMVNGQRVALITSADFTVERATENAVVVGSNSVADIFTGRIVASGNLNIYFENTTFRDMFNDESVISIVMALTADNTPGSQFVSFTFPKVKLNSHTLDDGELGLTASVAFQALLNDVSNTGLPLTTVSVQDSNAI